MIIIIIIDPYFRTAIGVTPNVLTIFYIIYNNKQLY
jgi:hypothetical protein